MGKSIGDNLSSIEKGTGKKYEAPAQSPWNPIFVFVLAVVYLILLAVSMSVGSLNTPAQHIKDFMNASHVARTGEAMAYNDIESLFGLMIALIGLGAGLGCLVSSYISDSIGRKKGLVLASLTAIAACVIMSLSKTAAYYEMLFVGRFITGFAAGLATTTAPAYVVEACVPKVKPTMALLCQLIQAFGLFATLVLGFDELLGTEELWPYLLGLPGIFCGLQLLLLIPFCPESPRYLLMKKNDSEKARKALRFIRERKDVENDIKELIKELEESKLKAHTSFLDLFKTPALRRSVLAAIVLGWYHNWSGVRGIISFSTKLFKDVGMTERSAKYATSGTGLILILGNLLGPYMMNRFNRKTLNNMGSVGMGVCCVIVAITMTYQDEMEALIYVNIAASLLLIAFWAVGPVCLFWIIVAELFPHSARAAGLGIAVQNVFFSYFAYSYIFPEMLLAMQGNTFYVTAAINVLMIVFVHFLLPETKDRSLTEILNFPKPEYGSANLDTNNKFDPENKQKDIEITRF